jgi:endonuclease YncB( thermonuclease family)
MKYIFTIATIVLMIPQLCLAQNFKGEIYEVSGQNLKVKNKNERIMLYGIKIQSKLKSRVASWLYLASDKTILPRGKLLENVGRAELKRRLKTYRFRKKVKFNVKKKDESSMHVTVYHRRGISLNAFLIKRGLAKPTSEAPKKWHYLEEQGGI